MVLKQFQLTLHILTLCFEKMLRMTLVTSFACNVRVWNSSEQVPQGLTILENLALALILLLGFQCTFRKRCNCWATAVIQIINARSFYRGYAKNWQSSNAW